jgi:hypothetical protein
MTHHTFILSTVANVKVMERLLDNQMTKLVREADSCAHQKASRFETRARTWIAHPLFCADVVIPLGFVPVPLAGHPRPSVARPTQGTAPLNEGYPYEHFRWISV